MPVSHLNGATVEGSTSPDPVAPAALYAANYLGNSELNGPRNYTSIGFKAVALY